MLLPLLLFIVPIIFGITVLTALNLLHEKIAIITIGALSGLAFVITVFYALSIFVVLTPFVIGLVLILFAAISTAILATTFAWKNFWNLETDRIGISIFVFTAALFLIIAPKMLIQKEDGLYTGIINAYGDVAWHAAVITTLADHPQFPPQNPIFANTRLIYPFLTDFFSAVLINAGSSLAFSINASSLVLLPLLVTILYCFNRDITGNRLAGFLATVLFLFGGATLGFTRFATDFKESGDSLWAFLTHLPNRDYSGVGTDTDGFHFLNPVFSLLLPQRAFLFGIPIALSILHFLIIGSQNINKRNRTYILAGVISGILPLFHAHTVLSVAIAVIAIFILYPSWSWIWFVLTAGIIGLPEVLFFATDLSGDGQFFRYDPGWLTGNRNWILYWLQNTGFIFSLIILGFFLRIPKLLKFLALAGLLIFAAANIWLFAPWAWDNFKLIIFWFIFSLPLVGYVLATTKKSVVFIVALLVLFQSASAILDVWKVALPTAPNWLEWSTESRIAAEMIKTNTQPGDVIVTASIHNSPVVLAGRILYLGYAAHVWSHGRTPWVRERAVSMFYTNKLNTLPETRADYVLVGPDELYKYKSVIIQPSWRFIDSVGNYRLYKL